VGVDGHESCLIPTVPTLMEKDGRRALHPRRRNGSVEALPFGHDVTNIRITRRRTRVVVERQIAVVGSA
jgi:hypothetical protein